MQAERPKLAEKYPYYFANKAVYANADLEVTDKFTQKVCLSCKMHV